MSLLVDSHYHLEFLKDPKLIREFLKAIEEKGLRVLSQSVSPSSYKKFISDSSYLDYLNGLCSIGFHPWYIQSEEQVQEELEIFKELIETTRFVGEIGLDFYPRRLEDASKELQLKVYESILKILCDEKSKQGPDEGFVLSIHGVRSSSQLLDLNEKYKLSENNIYPIFHRFAGTSDELTRHINLGGYISVGPHMLEVKKGRAYVKQIPGDRILLESDLPEEIKERVDHNNFQDLLENLIYQIDKAINSTLSKINEIRQKDMTEQIMETQKKLLGI